MSAPSLTVVIAASSRAQALDESVRALAAGCLGVETELIIVASADVAPDAAGFASVRRLPCSTTTLVPERWGAGAREAVGSVVAFTTDQLRVGDGWARTLLEAIDGGAAGVGGPIALGADADAATAAAHLIRFSAFLPGAHRVRHAVSDIAGDNAAYELAAIRRHDDLLRDGFWEVEFHRRFERDGRVLEMVPQAAATFVGPVSTDALARQRYQHARAFGRARVRDHGESALRIAVAAPIVPLVLLNRVRRRAASDSAARRRFLPALPRLLALSIAWAVGEVAGAIGAVSARPSL